MRSLVCLPFCLLLFLLCLTAETRQHSSECCLKTNNIRIPKKRVVRYTVQTAGVCHIDAIILWTLKGKAKCGDPGSEWIKSIMRMVDQKEMQKQNSDPKSLAKPKKKK